MKIIISSPITSWQIDGETMETVTDFIFLGSKITADGDCSHEIKRHLLLGRKAMTNLDSILKRRDITLPTKVHIVKAMVFPVVMYGCESWTIKKAEHQRIDAFKFWCCCRKGDPFQGPKLGSCLKVGNELSKEMHMLTKQEILLGKGAWVASSRVREPRRTALPRGSQSWVLW